ncbi:MAG TPA: hypothetical protein VMD07_05655 [Candidatus Acidoferrales bacterium]|nr:hypothetical protein [Candidatus Acidoferrales bacterium]
MPSVGPIAAVINIPPAMVAAAEAAAQESMSTALQQAVLQQETAASAGGGGGGGAKGGHSKEAIDAITRLAASIDAKPTARVKTVAERQAEIEKMKREAQQNPQQRDLTDERQQDAQKRAREQNPLLAFF